MLLRQKHCLKILNYVSKTLESKPTTSDQPDPSI